MSKVLPARRRVPGRPSPNTPAPGARPAAGSGVEALERRVVFADASGAFAFVGPAAAAPVEPTPEAAKDLSFRPINTDIAAEAIVTQPDDKLVIAGHRQDLPRTGQSRAVVQRFNADGTRDVTFGKGGVVEGPPDQNELFYALAIQPDNKLVVAGRSGGDFIVARYNPDGTPDTTFGAGGRTETDFGSLDSAFALALDAAGNIVVGGNAFNAFAFARYTASGVLDPSFGTGGTLTLDVGPADDAVGAVAVQSDGRIVATGAGGGGGAELLVTRLNPDGSTDTAFTGGGAARGVPGLVARGDLSTAESSAADRTQGLAVQADNKIVIANRTPVGDFGIARLNADGSLDTAFGANGLAVADFGRDDDADFVSVQAGPANAIVAVGTSANDVRSLIAVAAFNPDGTPVADYGEAGKTVKETGLPRGRLFRSGALFRRALASLRPGARRLVAGASDIEGAPSRSAFSRVLVPVGGPEPVLGTFGQIEGRRRPTALTVPNTRLRLSLTGGGAGELLNDPARPGQVKLVVTGTTPRSSLSVTGPGRLALGNLSVDGPLGRFNGRNVDLAGTTFIDGAAGNLSFGNVRGTAAAPATVAAGRIGSLDALSLENARVLSGADLGVDDLPGGDDRFRGGRIGAVRVAGAVAASFVGAGVDPVNGIFGDGDDALAGSRVVSRIERVTATGGVDATTVFEAGAFGRIRRLGRERVDVATDPRFRVLG